MYLGLRLEQIGKILEPLRQTTQVQEAFVFGSRAKGTYKAGSDIDLAVKGKNIKPNDLLDLHNALDELDLPYKIDLINYDKIKDPDVTNHIGLVGVRIYLQNQEKHNPTGKRLNSKNFIQPAKSQSIEKVAYSTRKNILEVEIKEGRVYQYFPVPVEGWNEFKKIIEQGESAGKYYNFVVKHKYDNYREVIPMVHDEGHS
jgi:predicted nucleotidyltransferase